MRLPSRYSPENETKVFSVADCCGMTVYSRISFADEMTIGARHSGAYFLSVDVLTSRVTGRNEFSSHFGHDSECFVSLLGSQGERANERNTITAWSVGAIVMNTRQPWSRSHKFAGNERYR
jgi:hypothetical protein